MPRQLDEFQQIENRSSKSLTENSDDALLSLCPSFGSTDCHLAAAYLDFGSIPKPEIDYLVRWTVAQIGRWVIGDPDVPDRTRYPRHGNGQLIGD
jgi:hypothetical protein